MGTVLMPVLVLHPFQHSPAAVIVEVGIDIRQGDTVGIQETLEQQIVLQRVYLRDAQTIGNHRTGSRTTSRADHHAQLVAGRVDKVLNDEEVARETHRLHDVQLETDTLYHLLRKFLGVLSIP